MKAYFNNTVKVEWSVVNPREMTLLEDISFTDSTGKVWFAPKGSVIDGASIPKFFWRTIGSPFVGYYRRPSVIHDVYCVTRSEPHESVHNMFHEAMLCDGVNPTKAIIMYEAVMAGGPKWDEDGKDLVNEEPDDRYAG